MQIKELVKKHWDVVGYAVFGVLTTLVNIVAYYVLAHPVGIPVLPSSIAAWVISVAFAYLTNRTWVFSSQAVGAAAIAREMAWFFGCRLATGALDWANMFVFVDLLALDDLFVKVASNVLVVILNYLASKLFIFAK